MESNMFCYQCQETAKGTGCILKGVWKRKPYGSSYGLVAVCGQGHLCCCRYIT